MRTETFDALARLLAYPRPDFRDALAEALAAAPQPVATSLARFDEAVAGLQPHELEEAFTTTFDLDPVAALEVGWHLFGDTYERGRFLVEMRQRLHRLGMSESGELPDHLATVLRVLPRLDARDAEQLVQGAVMPALHKMLEPLRSRESLFLPLLQAVDALLAEAGTGCAGPFPDVALNEKRTAAGGSHAATPATVSHEIDPEVTA